MKHVQLVVGNVTVRSKPPSPRTSSSRMPSKRRAILAPDTMGKENYAGTPFLKNKVECAPFQAGSGATSACDANSYGHHAPLCYCDDALAPLPHTLGSRTFQAGIAGLSGDMDSLDGVYWTEWFDRGRSLLGSGGQRIEIHSREFSRIESVEELQGSFMNTREVGVGECWDEDLGWHGSAYQMTEVNNDPETCYQGT